MSYANDVVRLLSPTVEILALAEPTHGDAAFPEARTEILRLLAEHCVRSVALETDAVLAQSMTFSHGMGDLAANQALLAWLRDTNRGRSHAERIEFYGFDAPLEMISAPSPRAYLAE